MPRFFIDPNIARAKTISTDLYLDEALFEDIKEKVFATSWQFVTDKNQLHEKQAAYPFTFMPGLLNEPLLLSRDTRGKLHCLSNVCTHRGNVLVHEPCSLQHIQCKYHGRRFGLDGSFQFMPEFSSVENFPSQDDNLKSLPVFEWSIFLFAALQDDVLPDKYFSAMMDRMQWLPLHEFTFRPDLSNDFMVAANWALYCENYLEGFHIPFVHAGLNEVIDYGGYTTEIFEYANLQVGLAKEGEMAFDLPEDSPDYGKRVGGYYFWVFPNLMFNFYPWGLSINIVKPQSIDTTQVTFLTYVWDEKKLDQGAGGDLLQVEKEDEEVVEAVQKGIRSRFYTHGRYAPFREQGTHHFHQIMAKCIG